MKKALVTGASRGIGYAIAKKLSQNDCKVVITGRNIETLERVASELGKNVLPMVWNAMDFDKANEKIAQAADMLGGLDIVVNNAGIFAQRYEWDKHELLKTTPREWSDVITVNASAVFFTMQAAVNYMLEHHIKGNIVSTTGADDAMVAAYVFDLQRGADEFEAFRYACAAGAATEFKSGLATRNEIEECYKLVKIERKTINL